MPPAYEVLLLNTAIPQIQAAQSGDTYVVPRDIAFSTVASFAAGAEATPSIVATGDTNTGIWFPAADTVAISTGGISRMRLDSSGNLGLGVTPSAWGSAYRTAFQNKLASLTGLAGTSVMELSANFYLDNTGTGRYIATDYATQYQQLFGAHKWFTAPSGTAGDPITFTQAMTLDASGNLGIGTTSPKIEMQTKASGGIQAASDLELAIRYNMYNSGGDKYIQAANKASSLVMDLNGNFLFYNTDTASTAANSAVTGLAERVRITTSGNLNLQKNLGLGGTAATTSGVGITFPATQSASSDANTLDDYEEGTCNITTVPSAGFTPTNNVTTGYYTKIGNVVVVTGIFEMSVPASLGTYSNDNVDYAIAVQGLPFAINNTSALTRSAPVIGVGSNLATNSGVLAGHGDAGNTTFFVYQNKNDGSSRSSPTLTVSTNVSYHFQFTYRVA